MGRNIPSPTTWLTKSYNGQVYDFAMVTFTWSQNEPPVIPKMTVDQDDLAAGSDVKFLGYGVTQNNNNNSTRYYFDGDLQQVQALTVSYNQSTSGSFANDGGPCFGDSGGPALFNLAGTGELVAAITSYGDQDCTEFGVSGRVSAVEGWIDDYIANGGGGMSGQTCDQCSQETLSGGGACAGSWNTCLNDSQCLGFVECLNACQTQACADQCVADYPNGVDQYLTDHRLRVRYRVSDEWNGRRAVLPGRRRAGRLRLHRGGSGLPLVLRGELLRSGRHVCGGSGVFGMPHRGRSGSELHRHEREGLAVLPVPRAEVR